MPLQEVIKLKGKSSHEFQKELGYHASEEVVHRENLALLAATADDVDWPSKGFRDKLATSEMESLEAAESAGDGGNELHSNLSSNGTDQLSLSSGVEQDLNTKVTLN